MVNLDSTTKVTTVSDEQRVGSLVKTLRADSGLSVRTLASLAGFSASFVSQVEHGHVSPSIASLERLVHVLGVSLGEFFQRLGDPSTTVVRANQRTQLESGWSRARIEGLGTPGPGCALEALLVTLRPGGRSAANSGARSADEFAFVLSGSLILEMNGQTLELGAGDAATLPAGILHRWKNAGDADAEFLVVSGRPAR
jgi:quercetin dioxygenase-like cupin family protein/DNA-binding transcriptional regulator YiaG